MTLAGRIALVTGGSRGVGAATVLALARARFDVVVNYRNKARRAEEIAASARQLGVQSIAAQADVTETSEVSAMFERIATEYARLDVLVLNASGGMERGVDEGYAMRVNRDAPLALVDSALPLMPSGSVVVFVTSHLAHYYGQIEQYPQYEPVAESKHAGEQALVARVSELASHGVRLAIVSGDLIEDTVVPRLMDRLNPGLIERRRAQVERLPTTEDMAEAIVRAAQDDTLPSGQVVYVGEHAISSTRRGTKHTSE